MPELRHRHQREGRSLPTSVQVQPVVEQPRSCAPPCTMVIMGARGDLTRRKLMPALAHLAADGLLHDAFRLIGVGKQPQSDDEFRAAMLAAVTDSGEVPHLDARTRAHFLERLCWVAGDLRDAETYRRLHERLAAIEGGGEDAPLRGHRLFYLAIPPDLYPDAVRHLSESGLAPRHEPVERGGPGPWARVVIEKPFGRDLASARALNRQVRAALDESQVFRIDHYLGKETVQNLLVHRFANSIFEPVWNRDHVKHVQITVAETVGVEQRAGFYEQAGVIRDVVQNHLLQLLALTTMEPPNTFAADAVRNEKVKLLGAIPTPTEAEARQALVVGQYGAGSMAGEPVPGYREEPGVAPASGTPTFAALRLGIQNWRWKGVPFFLRSGKRMATRCTEIAVQFRRPPHLLFDAHDRGQLEANVLSFRIQPEEEIALGFQVKVPGPDVRVTPVRMVFSYDAAFHADRHPAYETLILDAMEGDATLFDRSDAVEEAWRIVDPFIAAASASPNYPAGTWGPAAADELMSAHGFAWRNE